MDNCSIYKEQNKTEIQDSIYWYAIRTFYCKEETVGEYFKSKELEYFIPSCYKEHISSDGKKSKKLVPAVRNLLFLKKTLNEQDIKHIINECPVQISVIKNRDTQKYYNIPDEQMVELRAICDPNYENTIYTDASFAEARRGDKVIVTRGQFKGLKGKLTRYKNRSYVIITMAELGIMIHIPKWYCKKIEEVQLSINI